MTDISRYSSDSAATYNAALQSLEDLYNSTGNAMELIAEGTATAATVISMGLGSASWAFLTLRATLIPSTALTLRLCANNDYSQTSTYYTSFFDTNLSGGGNTLGFAYIGYGDNTTVPMNIEATIWPHTLGFSMFCSCSVLTTGPALFLLRSGAVYTGGAVTSLQLVSVESPTYTLTGDYRLEGVRA